MVRWKAHRRGRRKESFANELAVLVLARDYRESVHLADYVKRAVERRAHGNLRHRFGQLTAECLHVLGGGYQLVRTRDLIGRGRAHLLLELLTDEELDELEARLASQDNTSDAALQITGVDESYNDFWVESAGLGEARMTSHLIYPENGRLPPLQPDAPRANFASAPARS